MPERPEEFVENYLEHYGVKGMKWGVINEDKLKGRKSGGKDVPKKKPKPSAPDSDIAKKSKGSAAVKKSKTADDPELVKKYKAESAKEPKLTKKQEIDALAENQKKFHAKFEGDGPEKHGPISNSKNWTPTPQQVALGLAGAAVVAYVGYSIYKGSKPGLPPGIETDAKSFIKEVNKSKMRAWAGGKYIKDVSYLQEEFTLPAGHVFHRISTSTEEGFRHATYATHSIEDYNRYLTAFRGEKGPGAALNHVTFSTSEDLKVPSLVKRLEVMKSVLSESGIANPTEADALKQYQSLSGGSWSGSTAGKFFAKLSEEGFGAIIDDMDAGVIGESPLVIFKHDSMSKKVVSPITAEDIAKAESTLVELMNRK